jgi:hypothetical protein
MNRTVAILALLALLVHQFVGVVPAYGRVLCLHPQAPSHSADDANETKVHGHHCCHHDRESTPAPAPMAPVPPHHDDCPCIDVPLGTNLARTEAGTTRLDTLTHSLVATSIAVIDAYEHHSALRTHYRICDPRPPSSLTPVRCTVLVI